MTTTSLRRRAGRASLLALAPLLGAAAFAAPALAAHHTKSHADHSLHADHGFVAAVAGNDGLIKVKTADHGELTLNAGKSLRHTVDAVSVTDYVIFTYETFHKDKLVLKTLHDTSVADSGRVAAIASSHKGLTVKTAHGVLKLGVAKPSLLDAVKVGESVDVDYYKASNGELVLVTIGRKAPGVGGGSGKNGSSGSGSSGSGSSGSGSAGSGSWGSAGSGWSASSAS